MMRSIKTFEKSSKMMTCYREQNRVTDYLVVMTV